MTIDLESEIQSAWLRANSLLAKESPALSEIDDAIADLRRCAMRVRETDSPGERELWWLIKRLAGLKTDSYTSSYLLADLQTAPPPHRRTII